MSGGSESGSDCAAPVSGRAFARAALLGNPSDGFGGKTIGLTIANFRAEVTLGDGEANADGEASRLIAATIERFNLATGTAGHPPASLETSIPKEVGLGGSSAIAIATLRALCALSGVRLHPDEIAALALAVETKDLGIAAGPQDRFIQAHEGLLCMDFSPAVGDRCERLDPALLPPLFLAYRRDAGAPSSGVHGELRRRFEAGDARTRTALAEIAALADRGRDCLLAGRTTEFGDLMRRNFELRGELVELEPRHVGMVELARSFGAPSNYAGSGGAIVGVSPSRIELERLRRALAAAGCELLDLTPAG
jgi:galactokinase/mevalonate kinase-like predicted kinase